MTRPEGRAVWRVVAWRLALPLLVAMLVLTPGHAGGSVGAVAQTAAGFELVSHRIGDATPPDSFPAIDRPVSYQRVFPPDDRVRQAPTTAIPASAVVLIAGRVEGSRWRLCSGTLIGPDVVLTAAHCLYDHEHGWVTDVAVAPGADGEELPFGYTGATDLFVPTGWADLGDAQYDLGVAVLVSPLGEAAGWLPVDAVPTEDLADPAFAYTVAGYPGDKQPENTQWWASGTGFVRVTDEYLFMDADAYQGMSGGPVWRSSDATVVGVVSHERASANVARRIDATALAFIVGACEDAGCTVGGAPAGPTTPGPPETGHPAVPGPQPVFTVLEPARYGRVAPGLVLVRVVAVSDSPAEELVVRVAGQEFSVASGELVTGLPLAPGVYTAEAVARDREGDTLRVLWDFVVSDDPNESVWFDGSGQPKAEQVNATLRALVEAFRWHLYGVSWDGNDHRGDMPTHAEALRPPEPVPAWVVDGEFDRAATDATLRSLVEAFRWHFWGISWDGAPHHEVPTHARDVLPPEPVGPWFTPEGQPIRENIEATLRALNEAFRWHLYGATWDGFPHPELPTHAGHAS